MWDKQTVSERLQQMLDRVEELTAEAETLKREGEMQVKEGEVKLRRAAGLEARAEEVKWLMGLTERELQSQTQAALAATTTGSNIR